MESIDSEAINRAYEFCREVTKKHAKSFYFSARFLKPEKRRPIYALYALCRLVDDEVDEADVSSEKEAIQAVENWKKILDVIYSHQFIQTNQTGITASPRHFVTASHIISAWQDMLKTYKIRQDLPLELMKGVLMDTHLKRYETWDELYVYCYRVASVVGLMSSEIFGYEKPETLDYAESLGIAMQLTNILRDIKEDAAMGRIYLPQEDLQKFGVTEKQIFSNELNENFAELMKFQIERARHYYQRAELGIPLLSKDARFCVLLAARIYGRILDEIEKQSYDIFSRRAHTTKWQKISSIPKIWREARKL